MVRGLPIVAAVFALNACAAMKNTPAQDRTIAQIEECRRAMALDVSITRLLPDGTFTITGSSGANAQIRRCMTERFGTTWK